MISFVSWFNFGFGVFNFDVSGALIVLVLLLIVLYSDHVV
jgi:hypothetical protein